MDLYIRGLSIGELAKRTGVSVSTLRAWERRHGFPSANRLPSGHRRYAEQDVEILAAILRQRRNGITLAAALDQAKADRFIDQASVFAALRRALSPVPPIELSKRAMIAISHAIEDEAAAHAGGALMIGSFQHPRFWRQAQHRWRQLAPAAATLVALATFTRARYAGRVFEVPVARTSPLSREWAVVCDGPTLSACLVGVERLSGRSNGSRRFEALWTVDPSAVREATRAAAAAADQQPALAELMRPRLSEPATATYDTIRLATALTNRIVASFDRDDR